jgi:hypothetical protein
MGLFFQFLSQPEYIEKKKATEFCILILYPATLLKVFIRSKDLFYEVVCVI